MNMEPDRNSSESELLLRRAERLRQGQEKAEDDNGLWAAEFPLGHDHYAVALESLTACLPLRDVTPVPLSAPGVVGVMRWEGNLISVFSLASLLGVQGWKTDPSVLLVLESPGGTVAVDCETVPRGNLLPPSAQAAIGDGDAVTTLHLEGRRPLEWINMPRLVKNFLAGQKA